MPTILRRTALGIAAVADNVLAGSEFEFLPRAARIRVYQVSDQVDTTLDVSFGNAIQTQAAVSPLEPAANQGPFTDRHLIVDDVADAGDRIVVRVRGGAAASVTRTLVDITVLPALR